MEFLNEGKYGVPVIEVMSDKFPPISTPEAFPFPIDFSRRESGLWITPVFFVDVIIFQKCSSVKGSMPLNISTPAIGPENETIPVFLYNASCNAVTSLTGKNFWIVFDELVVDERQQPGR